MGTVIVADTEAVVVVDKHNEVVEPDIVVVDGRADSSVELLWAAAFDDQSIAPQQPLLEVRRYVNFSIYSSDGCGMGQIMNSRSGYCGVLEVLSVE